MNFYTHAVLANHLLPFVRPADPAGYLWGAVAPDIRYPAQMRRQATHLPDEEITAWFTRYPGCESFVQGYRVHCLLDRIDTVQALGRRFPFNLIRLARRKPFSPQQMGVVIELYYHKKSPQGVALAGEHNPILEALGIRAAQTATYAGAMADYLAHPSFETATGCFSRLGLIDDARIDKYMHAYRSMAKHRLLLWLLMTGVRNARLEKLAHESFSQMKSGS